MAEESGSHDLQAGGGVFLALGRGLLARNAHMGSIGIEVTPELMREDPALEKARGGGRGGAGGRLKRRRALRPESGQAVSILLEGGVAWRGWWEKASAYMVGLQEDAAERKLWNTGGEPWISNPSASGIL